MKGAEPILDLSKPDLSRVATPPCVPTQNKAKLEVRLTKRTAWDQARETSELFRFALDQDTKLPACLIVVEVAIEKRLRLRRGQRIAREGETHDIGIGQHVIL